MKNIKIGDLICVWRKSIKDITNETAFITTAKSEPYKLAFSGPDVIMVDGIPSPVILDCVRTLTFHESAKDYFDDDGHC